MTRKAEELQKRLAEDFKKALHGFLGEPNNDDLRLAMKGMVQKQLKAEWEASGGGVGLDEDERRRLTRKPRVRFVPDKPHTIQICVGDVDEEEFRFVVGREPYNDDLERVNCTNGRVAGFGFGHSTCGWCHDHDRPVFECMCLGKGE